MSQIIIEIGKFHCTVCFLGLQFVSLAPLTPSISLSLLPFFLNLSLRSLFSSLFSPSPLALTIFLASFVSTASISFSPIPFLPDFFQLMQDRIVCFVRRNSLAAPNTKSYASARKIQKKQRLTTQSK